MSEQRIKELEDMEKILTDNKTMSQQNKILIGNVLYKLKNMEYDSLIIEEHLKVMYGN